MDLTKNSNRNWLEKYNLLKAYVEEYHHLPDKKKIEQRRLLNWWKYNKRRAKSGCLTDEKRLLLQKLSNMRKSHYIEF